MKFDLSSSQADKSLIKRVGLCIQYDGSQFCGWQKQIKGNSVQGFLEEAISDLDGHRPIKVIAAGRTDAGVHAAGQVVHFDCSGYIPSHKWAAALNGRLPKTIRIRESVGRPKDWHACYSAVYRRYRYTIYNGRTPNLFLAPWTWHRYSFRLDEKLMTLALKELIGFYDFGAFQRAGSKRSNSFTTIQDVLIERQGDLVNIEIQASGFLYGMVRLLVRQLVAVGEHKLSLELFLKIWQERRRDQVREAAPSNGLCFIRAGYKELIFSESAWFDSLPKFSLVAIDPPPDPS